MPRRLGTTVGLCASAGALAALVLTATVPGSDAAPAHVVGDGRHLRGRAHRFQRLHRGLRPPEEGEDQDPHQARGRDLRREHLLRPLLRHLSQGDQQGRGHEVQGEEEHARERQPGHVEEAEEEPQPLQAVPPRPRRGADLRPEPQLHRRAAGSQRRRHGPVRPERQRRHLRRPLRCSRPDHGLLRRQHGHGPVELRPELRDVRPLLRQQLRAVDAGRDQPGVRQHPRLHRGGLRRRERRSRRPEHSSTPTRSREWAP